MRSNIPQAVYETNFLSQCVLRPGLINLQIKDNLLIDIMPEKNI